MERCFQHGAQQILLLSIELDQFSNLNWFTTIMALHFFLKMLVVVTLVTQSVLAVEDNRALVSTLCMLVHTNATEPVVEDIFVIFVIILYHGVVSDFPFFDLRIVTLEQDFVTVSEQTLCHVE